MTIRGTIQSKQGLIGKVVSSPVNRTSTSSSNRIVIQSKQGLIGKVVNSPVNRTTISSSNFKPTPNVAMSDITDVDVTLKENGNILIYNSSSGKLELSRLVIETTIIDNINGGRF